MSHRSCVRSPSTLTASTAALPLFSNILPWHVRPPRHSANKVHVNTLPILALSLAIALVSGPAPTVAIPNRTVPACPTSGSLNSNVDYFPDKVALNSRSNLLIRTKLSLNNGRSGIMGTIKY
ncbi:hypothetical protein M427DRAFT_183186 [Gonapodya prolifera JEL478]|uniref:Uncharacterized protein n=1 Tax=Gonapodya prolifera (strain JEL478) TaxID=1344416 RepID=A0A139A1X5_GONPJ|nr:hypothetical protein M427DRAFT_183186 [Gonapodya prolifera JEL478]|eukprot:KXS10363.1 hypothetical protein M427DRAFT_183186 [Gonapodya prolifera JEL478]